MPILSQIRHPLRWLLFAIFFGASVRGVSEEEMHAPEYKIKAAFLYNFAVLTQWSTNAFESAKSPLVIALVGKDPFGRVIDEMMRGKKIHGRKIEIERFGEADDLKKCHLLFVCSSEEPRVEELLCDLGGAPILTVSDIDHFNDRGGMIWLKKEKDEIKFRIQQEVVSGTGLKLSSKLLTLATNAKNPEKEEK